MKLQTGKVYDAWVGDGLGQIASGNKAYAFVQDYIFDPFWDENMDNLNGKIVVFYTDRIGKVIINKVL